MPSAQYKEPRTCPCGYSSLSISNWNRHKLTCRDIEKPIDKIVKQNEELTKIVDQLRATNGQLQTSNDELRAQLAAKDEQPARLREQLAAKEEQLSTMRSVLQVSSQAMSLVRRQDKRPTDRAQRQRLLDLANGRCGLCGVVVDSLFDVDHIVPRADGGSDEDSNLQVLCLHCHRVKTVRECRERAAR